MFQKSGRWVEFVECDCQLSKSGYIDGNLRVEKLSAFLLALFRFLFCSLCFFVLFSLIFFCLFAVVLFFAVYLKNLSYCYFCALPQREGLYFAKKKKRMKRHLSDSEPENCDDYEECSR